MKKIDVYTIHIPRELNIKKLAYKPSKYTIFSTRKFKWYEAILVLPKNKKIYGKKRNKKRTL